METIKYIIPVLLTALVVYLPLYRFFRNEAERRACELTKQRLQVVTPTRLRAYERLTLLLERINPNNLLVRKITTSNNCLQLQTEALDDIRREFEHNVSQQIYVSDSVWEAIENARENLVQLIHVAAAQCTPDAPAAQLANIIIETYNTPEETALSAALETLKDEVRRLF